MWGDNIVNNIRNYVYYKYYSNKEGNVKMNRNNGKTDQQILDSFSWEQKVGKELYHGNDDPISDEVRQNQFNNRSTDGKLYNGGIDSGYAVQQNPRGIIAVHKEDGNIAAVKLDDGTILSKQEAIELTKQGGIKDVNVGRRGSREILRSNPINDAGQSLSNLPRF